MYIISGSILIENYLVNKQEEVTDLEKDLPSLKVQVNTTSYLVCSRYGCPASKVTLLVESKQIDK